MATQILPQVQVFQVYDEISPTIVEPLRALIVGPDFHVEKYTETNKDNVLVGQYDATISLEAGFPSRDSGDSIDQTFTKVFIEDADLKFYDYSIGAADWSATPTSLESTLVLATGNGFTRDSSLPRNVRVGDYVWINAAGQTTFTRITGLVPEVLPSAVAPTAEASDLNPGDTTAASSSANATGSISGNSLTVDASSFDGLSTGDITDVYVVNIVTSGDTENAGEVLAEITSQSGNDTVVGTVALTETAGDTIIPLGTRGATVTVDTTLFTAGDQIEVTVFMDFTAVEDADITGTYTGGKDTTYSLEVTQGGVVGTDTVIIRARALSGVNDFDIFNVLDDSATSFGSLGLSVAFDNGDQLAQGDVFTVAATAAAPGPINTLTTVDNIDPAIVAQPDVNVKIFSRQDIEVPRLRPDGSVAWAQTATTFTLNDNLVVDDNVLGNSEVYSGTVYVEWRGYRTSANTGAVQSITNVAQLSQYFTAETGPESVLAYGVRKALANSNGLDVRFIAVADENLTSWTDALELTTEVSSVYGFVPLTLDRAVHEEFASHVNSLSSPELGRWRVTWLPTEVSDIDLVVGDEDTVATIDEYSATPGQNILVESSTVAFVDEGVRSGDTIRTNYSVNAIGEEMYDEYIVDLVINNNQLILESGPTNPIAIPERFEIWRTLNSNDKVSKLILENSYGSKRVRKIFPGTIEAAEGTVSSMFVAAAYAGFRSGVAPHQGLTNVAITGFSGVPEIRKFTRAQLDQLANAGYFIVTQYINSGTIYARKQLTTDVSSVAFAEDSVVSSDDAIAYSYASVLAKYIGRTNVTPSNLALIRADLNAMTQSLRSRGFSRTLGGLVIDAEIRSLRPHAIFPDRVVVVMDVIRPAPLNNLELYLVYSFLEDGGVDISAELTPNIGN